MASLKAFFNSSDYAPLRRIREKTARSKLVAIEGYLP
jgi:uncharacterized protein (DUF1330 family)